MNKIPEPVHFRHLVVHSFLVIDGSKCFGIIIGLGYQTQASTQLPFIFGIGDVIWTCKQMIPSNRRASFSSHLPVMWLLKYIYIYFCVIALSNIHLDLCLNTVQITFIFIDFRVCDFAFAFKTQNAPCVSRFRRVLFSDRFQFAS